MTRLFFRWLRINWSGPLTVITARPAPAEPPRPGVPTLNLLDDGRP